MDNQIIDPAISGEAASLIDHNGNPIQIQQSLPLSDDDYRRSHPSTESNNMVRLEGGPNHGTKLEIPDPTPVNRGTTDVPTAETMNPSDHNLISQAFGGYAIHQAENDIDGAQQAMADFAGAERTAGEQTLITPSTLPMGLLPAGTVLEGGAVPAQLPPPTDFSEIRHPITGAPIPTMHEVEIDLSTFPYHINLHKDVVSGKGGKIQQINRHFRNLVAAQYPLYDSTSSKISKRKIGLNIYHEILEKGGRFLDQEGNVMDQNKALLKVMKALKDAKIWTSDQKRLAKRKRESKKNQTNETPARIEKLLLPPQPPAPSHHEVYGEPAPIVAIAAQEVPLLGGMGGDDTEKKENGLSLLYQAMDGNKMLAQDGTSI